MCERLCSNLETLTNFHRTFMEALTEVPMASDSEEEIQREEERREKARTEWERMKGQGASDTDAAAAAAATLDNDSSTTASTATPAQSSSSPANSLPSLFLRYSEFFRLYIPYLNNYEPSLRAFNELRTHKHFSAWLAGDVRVGLRAHAAALHAPDLDLLSYMIQPVQRVPRYVLLLKELRRQTPLFHPEYLPLNEAIAKVSNVAAVINEGQRAVENMNKLLQLQQRVHGDFESLVQPHRRLIKEGPVTATYAHGLFGTLRTRASLLFLFSDALMWTNASGKFKGLIDLTPAKLSPKSSTAFVIDLAQRAIHIACETEEETKEWFEMIDEVVCALQNERERLRARQKSRHFHSSGDGGAGAKDDLHKLVKESLQGLAVAAAEHSVKENGLGVDGSGSVSSLGHLSRISGSAAGASGGTVGRSGLATLGQRSGRKWEESLETTLANNRSMGGGSTTGSRSGSRSNSMKDTTKKQHGAADGGTSPPGKGRNKIGSDTFRPPSSSDDEDDDEKKAELKPNRRRVEFADFPSTSSSNAPSSNASSSASTASPSNPDPLAPVPTVPGEKRYVPRFVTRRGRTLGKNDCLCTTILLHRDCPQHGEAAQLREQQRLQAEAEAEAANANATAVQDQGAVAATADAQ